MTDTVRLLVERMAAEDLDYPLHLGVTEAGNALEGRIKSAVGIGSLLSDGIGDTIRVSLSEDPCNEIPVAEFIAKYAGRNAITNFEAGCRRQYRTKGPSQIEGHTARHRRKQCHRNIWRHPFVASNAEGVEIMLVDDDDKISRMRGVMDELVKTDNRKCR